MRIDRYELVDRFGGAVEAGVGALFVGAGLSAAAGLPNWPRLLEPLAKKLGVPISPSDDLPLLAEYFEHDPAGGRPGLEFHILNELGSFRTPSAGHQLVAALPVREIWTTNYDPLLELAIGDCVVAAKDEDVLHVGDEQRSVIKMHGSIGRAVPADWESPPVITRGDYERYEETHPRMWARLRATYMTRTMLFLGFSFTDPNVELLLRLARRYGTTTSSGHVTVLRRPTDPGELRSHELRVLDLERSGVGVHVIDDYAELEPLLQALVRRTKPPRFFISGSGTPVELKPWCDALALALANRPHGWQLASLGGPSAWELTREVALLRQARNCYRPENLLIYFRLKQGEPAPPMDARVGTAIFTDLEREPLVASVLDECRALLVLGGGAKTEEEVRWAEERGLGIVPLATTGGTAQATWDRLSPDPPDLGGRPLLGKTWRQLADPNPSIAVLAAMTALDQAMYGTPA